MFKSTLKYNIHRKQELKHSCVSLVYMDISVVPHKLLGHVLVESMDYMRNAAEFDLGKFDKFILLKKITCL